MKRHRAAPAAAASLLLAVPVVALGQAGSRQTATLTFDEQRPAQSTGTSLAIDYVNGTDASAKPPAVEQVVIKLASGAVIDDSAPLRCGASDAELMANGPSACPAGSRVGGGALDLDTGIEGPGRVVPFDVTLLNNKGELILLLESKSQPTSRIVTRATIQGATITSDVPPTPGGPPDGYAAIKRVRLKLANVRGYVTTPPSCPPEGAWTNTLSFAYRDGATQAVSTTSPCTETRGDAPAIAPPATSGETAARDVTAPRIRLGGVPHHRCADRDFAATIRIQEAQSGLRSAQLRLDGRRLLVTQRAAFSRRIRAAGLRRGLHRLTLVAIDNAGNRAVRRASFRRCSTSRAGAIGRRA